MDKVKVKASQVRSLTTHLDMHCAVESVLGYMRSDPHSTPGGNIVMTVNHNHRHKSQVPNNLCCW